LVPSVNKVCDFFSISFYYKIWFCIIWLEQEWHCLWRVRVKYACRLDT
jgi:hypothetical protein